MVFKCSASQGFLIGVSTIQSGDVLKAIETAIPATAIEEASPNVHTPPWGIANTEADEERKRSLPVATTFHWLHCFKQLRLHRSNLGVSIVGCKMGAKSKQSIASSEKALHGCTVHFSRCSPVKYWQPSHGT